MREEIYLFDGIYAETPFNEITAMYRRAIDRGYGVTEEYSGTFGPFALRKGRYILFTSRNGFGIGRLNTEETKITYVELDEENYTDLLINP